MQLATRWLLAFAVCVSAASCRGDETSRLSAEEAAKLLENRNWMDHWPRSSNEQLYVYRFTPQMGGGVFQDRTLFKGVFELFVYEVAGSELRIRWPHNNVRDAVRFKIERVKGPHPFDLRLTLEGTSRGPSVYYGRAKETHADPLILPLE
jgi:hypothetical protein